MKKHTARNGRKMIIIFGWILIWQGLSVWIGNDILIAGPIEVGEALIRNIGNLEFIKSAGNSFIKISLGFFLWACHCFICVPISSSGRNFTASYHSDEDCSSRICRNFTSDLDNIGKLISCGLLYGHISSDLFSGAGGDTFGRP